MPKYIDVDEFIGRYGAYRAEMRITMLSLVDMLREEPPADVIPIEYIRKWHKEHYHTDACPLVDDYKSGG